MSVSGTVNSDTFASYFDQVLGPTLAPDEVSGCRLPHKVGQ